MAVMGPQIDTPMGDAQSPRNGAISADPVVDAFAAWMHTCAESGWLAASGAEVVGVTAAGARVTAEPVRALWSAPAYRAAAMDGIAVCAADTGTATAQRPARLLPEQFDSIDTGGPMPDGHNAVIMREHVRMLDDGSAEIDISVAPGRHVRPVGEDIQAGELVLPAGHRIRPIDAAALAGAGHHTVRVRCRPVVAIVPTGDEVRPIGAVLAPGEVLDTNSLMLAGMAEEAGGQPLLLPIAPDRPEEIAAAVLQAAKDADVVLVIAGSSAGRGDHTAAVVRRLGQVAVHGVAMRPGHPVLLGVLTGHRPVPLVGVPGYPGSAERALTCFVRPLLQSMLQTAGPPENEVVPARLACAVISPSHLDEYVRLRLACIVDPRINRETLVAIPLQRGAGALNTLTQTEAVLRIPLGATGFAAGTEVKPVLVTGAAASTATTIISGMRSPATEVLLELRRHELTRGSVQWIESNASDASETLASGLCHVAALVLGQRAEGGVIEDRAADPIAGLVARVGAVRVLEIARTSSSREVLVLPVAAWDSPPVVGLRTVLSSMAFHRRLLDCDGYSTRNAPPETWLP